MFCFHLPALILRKHLREFRCYSPKNHLYRQYDLDLKEEETRLESIRILVTRMSFWRWRGGEISDRTHMRSAHLPVLIAFLVARKQLYKPLCRSVRSSVRASVADYLEHATYGDRPCFTIMLPRLC